jgi:hypothetical protein
VKDYSVSKIFQAMENNYHYNYQSLDEFLRTDSDPKELGDQLDQLMADLVNVSRHEDDYGKALSDHHFTLRRLREIRCFLRSRQSTNEGRRFFYSKRRGMVQNKTW